MDQFWNLPQYRPYKRGLLGAGYVLSYSKRKRVHNIMGKEMGALTDVMASPMDNLSEESLLGVHWKELDTEVSNVAPTA